MSPTSSDAPGARPALQRRTVRVLMLTQIVGGVGVGSALSVGALLAEDLSGSETWSGLATTSITLGAALFAIPLARLAQARGRRAAGVVGWGAAALGAVVVIAAAQLRWFPLLLAALVVFGAGSAANLQARYAAIDLADDGNRASSLSLVVWSTTLGAVVGPSLNQPGAALGRALGLPGLAGPFVFSAVSFFTGAAITAVLLRPDPLLTARAGPGAAAATAAPSRPARPSVAGSLRIILRSRQATLALAAVILGHAVMVSVMAMTPVHLKSGGAGLTVVGVTISLHIAGMYALSPVVGRVADRAGRVPVILAGQLLLLAAVGVAGVSGHTVGMTMTGLVLLGLGWSCSMVAGSALLAESVPAADRPAAQGASDLLMNLAGAGGGAVSGSVLGAWGYGGLNAVAALVVLPVACVVTGYALGRAAAVRN